MGGLRRRGSLRISSQGLGGAHELPVCPSNNAKLEKSLCQHLQFEQAPAQVRQSYRERCPSSCPVGDGCSLAWHVSWFLLFVSCCSILPAKVQSPFCILQAPFWWAPTWPAWGTCLCITSVPLLCGTNCDPQFSMQVSVSQDVWVLFLAYWINWLVTCIPCKMETM